MNRNLSLLLLLGAVLMIVITAVIRTRDVPYEGMVLEEGSSWSCDNMDLSGVGTCTEQCIADGAVCREDPWTPGTRCCIGSDLYRITCCNGGNDACGGNVCVPPDPPPAVCGNGNIEGSEECDEGANNGDLYSVCKTDCTEWDTQCNDGEDNDGDGNTDGSDLGCMECETCAEAGENSPWVPQDDDEYDACSDPNLARPMTSE